jgi:hypothetical protein
VPRGVRRPRRSPISESFRHDCAIPHVGQQVWKCPVCHLVWLVDGPKASTSNEGKGYISEVTMRYPDGTYSVFEIEEP